MEAGDPIAVYNLGIYYREGEYGFPQDYDKALELWHRSTELGNAGANNSIGYAYDEGRGVEVDRKKGMYYYELAAMGGNVGARHNLGCMEEEAGKMDRAIKHFMIAVGGGYTGSLERIKGLYTYGHATKDDYTKALQLYQAYLGEIKSDQRDKAAEADERYRYY